MSCLKEREQTSVCLVVFFRIIEKLQKTTTDYITHHVEEDYPKCIGNTRKWLIWSSARQKMHSTKVCLINIASGRQWYNMVAFVFLHQKSINVKIQMKYSFSQLQRWSRTMTGFIEHPSGKHSIKNKRNSNLKIS